MVSGWGSLARVAMCCHLPSVLSKPGEPGAFVGSRRVGGTGALTRGSYRYLYPANPAPAAITAAMASHATRDRERFLVRPPRCPCGAAWLPGPTGSGNPVSSGGEASAPPWAGSGPVGVCQGPNEPVGG